MSAKCQTAAAQTHTTPSVDVIYQDRLFDDKFIALDPCYLYRQLFNLTRISMYFGYGFPFLVHRPQLIHYPRNNNAIDQGIHFTPKEICRWTYDQEHLLMYDTPPNCCPDTGEVPAWRWKHVKSPVSRMHESRNLGVRNRSSLSYITCNNPYRRVVLLTLSP